jgi:ABC-type multidrug transport system permease subunit
METVQGMFLIFILASFGGYFATIAIKDTPFFFKMFFLALAALVETAGITLFMNTDEHVDPWIIGAIVFSAVFTLWSVIYQLLRLRDYLRGQKNQTNI